MNVKQNLSILFYRKTKKKNSNGEIPIYARVTIDGFNDEFSTGIKVLFDQWDNHTKTVYSTAPNYKAINKKIGQIRTDLERHFDLIQAREGLAAPQSVINSYRTPVNGRDKEKQRMENFKFSDEIDEAIYSYLGWCHKFKKAYMDGKTPSAEKLKLFEQERIVISCTLKKLEKKASAIFEDKDRQKSLVMAVDEYLLNFTILAFEGHRSPNTLEKWIGRKHRYLDFLQHKCKASDIALAQLEFKFLNDSIEWPFEISEVKEIECNCGSTWITLEDGRTFYIMVQECANEKED